MNTRECDPQTSPQGQCILFIIDMTTLGEWSYQFTTCALLWMLCFLLSSSLWVKTSVPPCTFQRNLPWIVGLTSSLFIFSYPNLFSDWLFTIKMQTSYSGLQIVGLFAWGVRELFSLRTTGYLVALESLKHASGHLDYCLGAGAIVCGSGRLFCPVVSAKILNLF